MLPSSDQSHSSRIDHKDTLSVCDVMRDNTDEIIMKFESLFPSYLVNLADLQAEYLRVVRDLFGTCYIAEKELFEKLGVNQKSVQGFDNFLKVLTKSAISQIEIIDRIHKTFVSNAISAMKTSDDYIKLMLDRYAKLLATVSEAIPARM